MDVHFPSLDGQSMVPHQALSSEEIFSLLTATAYADIPGLDQHPTGNGSVPDTSLLNFDPALLSAPHPHAVPMVVDPPLQDTMDVDSPFDHAPLIHGQGSQLFDSCALLDGQLNEQLDGHASDGYTGPANRHLDGKSDGHLNDHLCSRVNGDVDGHIDCPSLQSHPKGHLDGPMDGHADGQPHDHLDGRVHGKSHGLVYEDGHANGHADGHTRANGKLASPHRSDLGKRKAQSYQLYNGQSQPRAQLQGGAFPPDGGEFNCALDGGVDGSLDGGLGHGRDVHAPHVRDGHVTGPGSFSNPHPGKVGGSVGMGKFSPFQALPDQDGIAPLKPKHDRVLEKRKHRLADGHTKTDGHVRPTQMELDRHVDGGRDTFHDASGSVGDESRRPSRSTSMQCLPSDVPHTQQQTRQDQHIHHPPHAYYPQQYAFQNPQSNGHGRSTSTSNYHANILAHHAAWMRSRKPGQAPSRSKGEGPGRPAAHAIADGYTSMDGHLDSHTAEGGMSDDEGYTSMDGNLDEHTKEGPAHPHQQEHGPRKRPSLHSCGSAPAELNKLAAQSMSQQHSAASAPPIVVGRAEEGTPAYHPYGKPPHRPRVPLLERRKLVRLREARAHLRQSLQSRTTEYSASEEREDQAMPPVDDANRAWVPSPVHPSVPRHKSPSSFETTQLASRVKNSYRPQQQSSLAQAHEFLSSPSPRTSPVLEKPHMGRSPPQPVSSALAPAAPAPLQVQRAATRPPLPPPPAREHGWESVVPPRSQDAVPITAYSSTGFDMLSALLRVASRPKPIISLGPVDLSAAFTVADISLPDHPLIYCSDTFLRLTGYERHEVIGRNCRFLQSPDGVMSKGQHRSTTDEAAVAHLARHLSSLQECQASLINYRKGGQPFLNLVSLIPIPWSTDPDIKYVVGFQVDLAAQPGAVLQPIASGGVAVNYRPHQGQHHRSHDGTYPSVFGPTTVTGPWNAATALHASGGMPDPMIHRAQQSQNPRQMANAQAIMQSLYPQSGSDASGSSPEGGPRRANWAPIVLENLSDVVYVLSLKGTVLYVSPSVERVVGWTPADMTGRSIGEFIHPADVVPVFRELKDSTSTAAIQAATRAGQAKMNANRAQAQRNEKPKDCPGVLDSSQSPSSDSGGDSLNQNNQQARTSGRHSAHTVGSGLNSNGSRSNSGSKPNGLSAKWNGSGSKSNGSGSSSYGSGSNSTDVRSTSASAADGTPEANKVSEHPLRAAPFGRWAAPTVHLLFRMRVKDSPLHRWIESNGRMHIEQGKGRKVVVSSARPRTVHYVPSRVLTAVATSSEPGFWARVSKDTGVLLTVTAPVVHLLGITAHQLTGQSVKDIATAEGAAALLTALHAPQTSLVKHLVKDSMNQDVMVLTQLYPSAPPPRLPIDMRSAKSEPRSVWVQARRVPPDVALEENVVYTTDAPDGIAGGSQMQGDEGVFSELDPQRAASWQYELHQLKHLNKRLRQDVQLAYARRKGQPVHLRGDASSRPTVRTPRLSETAMRDMLYPPMYKDDDGSPSQSSAGDRNTPVDRLFAPNAAPADEEADAASGSGSGEGSNASGRGFGSNGSGSGSGSGEAGSGSGSGSGPSSGSGSRSGSGSGTGSGSGSGSGSGPATSMTTLEMSPGDDGRRHMIHSSKPNQHSGESLLSHDGQDQDADGHDCRDLGQEQDEGHGSHTSSGACSLAPFTYPNSNGGTCSLSPGPDQGPCPVSGSHGTSGECKQRSPWVPDHWTESGDSGDHADSSG